MQDGWAIEYIKNPSEAVQLAAVQQNGKAIQYINNPSEAVQLAAVLQDAEAIEHIVNPSKEVQLAANPKAQEDKISMEDQKTLKEQLAAVRKNEKAIRYIANPSEEVALAAVKQNGYAIAWIDNPSEAVQLAAVKEDAAAIEYIDNPSEAVQLAAGIKISNKPQSTERIVMNSLVLNTIKTDSIKAGYRIASTQLTNVVRNSVINILRNQDIAESQLSAVHSFLSSEAGSSFVQYLLGLSLQYAPKIKDNVHVARVSRELRVEGITGAGSFLTSTLFSSLMPILSSIPEMRIEELAEEQASEVDILAAETEAIAQATGG